MVVTFQLKQGNSKWDNWLTDSSFIKNLKNNKVEGETNNRKKVKHTHTEVQPVYSMYALTLTPYFPHNSQLEKQLLK